jgi:hypothetical protein
VLSLRDIADPIDELADIWHRLRPLMLHMQHFNEDEATIREHQHGIIRDGCFLLPSPFAHAADMCRESYFHAHRFCYLFAHGEEEYFWITKDLHGAFALATMYFPRRRIAVTIDSGPLREEELRALDEIRSRTAKPERGSVPADGKRVVVTGFPHYMHTLWNELPALERAASAGLGSRIVLAALYQPLGPLTEHFPELATDARLILVDEVQEINEEYSLLVGLGSLAITQAAQQRVRAVAARHAGAAVVEERDHFRRNHDPVFWLSIKPPGRTCLRQSEVMARLIMGVNQEYPSAGFILNGTSLPWDAESNPNYPAGFSDGVEQASRFCVEVIEEILMRLPLQVRGSVRAVSGVSVCDEIVWGGAADFYFCHGGTMHNKIAWLHPIPGMIHTPRPFRNLFEHQGRVVEEGAPCYFVASHLICETEPEPYTSFGLQRTDVNYYFTSLDDVVRDFLDAFRVSTARYR